MKFLDSHTKMHIYFTNARQNFARESKNLKNRFTKITTKEFKMRYFISVILGVFLAQGVAFGAKMGLIC